MTRLGVGITLAACLSLPLAAENQDTSLKAYSKVPEPVEASPKRMTAEDLVTMPRLGSPAVTADGRYALFPVTETDAETYQRADRYFMLDLELPGSSPTEVDLGIDAFSLAFGPDNSLYFLSFEHTDEEAQPQGRVWRAILEANGNVTGPTPVADVAGTDIYGFKIAPSGKKIALWAEVSRDCPRLGCEEDGKAHLPGPGSGRLYQATDGFFRHWDRWSTPGTTSRVFIFGLEDGKVIGDGVPADGIDPGSGVTGNTPSMPFGGREEVAWSTDSSALYFVARESGVGEPLSTDLDIYASDLSGAAPSDLTQENDAVDTLPVPSPDGRYLAYLAMARPGYEADRMVIHLRDLKSGKTRALTKKLDLTFSDIVWTRDSRSILATTYEKLDTPVYRINIRNGKAKKLDLMAGNEAHISNLRALPGNRILFTRDSVGMPSELFLSEDFKQARPLTNIATSRMGEMASVVTKRFKFKGAEKNEVWGKITRLENQDGPIPAILYIHGGPQGTFNDGWSSRWNPRVLASQGYAVISVDFHGSVGYGQDFTDAINKDWGGKPLIDLQLGLEAALAEDPQIDGTRACAMGASYGGYMVNWIAGNWPDRFKCLVQHDGLFDLRSFYYSTEELWFPRWDFGGSYSEARETYEKWNPVNHVDKWQTPMLVITGERDFRVPYSQGLQSFTALKERGVPSQLLVFPDENHWVLGAANSLQWHNTVFGWLERWLKAEEAPEPSQ